MERHSLTVSSSRAASGEASAWVRSLAERAGFAEDRIDALDVCAVELVSNVVEHGYRGAVGQIRVELDVDGASANLTIIDAAWAFDPLSVPAPAPAPIENTKIGGWGMQLVRAFASRCRYERRGDLNVFIASFV